jgi:hypothetical protein
MGTATTTADTLSTEAEFEAFTDAAWDAFLADESEASFKVRRHALRNKKGHFVSVREFMMTTALATAGTMTCDTCGTAKKAVSFDTFYTAGVVDRSKTCRKCEDVGRTARRNARRALAVAA